VGGVRQGMRYMTSTGGETLPAGIDPKRALVERSVPWDVVERAILAWELNGEPLPLARVQLKHELVEAYKDLLPDIPWETARRIRGEQEIIVRYEPEQALATLPVLLADPADRSRLLTLLERLLADPRVEALGHTPEQEAMLARIREVLAERSGPRLAAA